jgi:hypothetical protein
MRAGDGSVPYKALNGEHCNEDWSDKQYCNTALQETTIGTKPLVLFGQNNIITFLGIGSPVQFGHPFGDDRSS